MTCVTDPRGRSGEDMTLCLSQIPDRGTFQAAGVSHRVGWRSLGGGTSLGARSRSWAAVDMEGVGSEGEGGCDRFVKSLIVKWGAELE